MLYNEAMPDFRVYTPIQVRFSDIDAMRHVNNARYLTYLEMARLDYLLALELWDARDFQVLWYCHHMEADWNLLIAGQSPDRIEPLS